MAPAAHQDALAEPAARAGADAAAAVSDPREPSTHSDPFASPGDLYVTAWRAEPAVEPLENPASEYAAHGLPARGVVLVSLAASGCCAAIDLALTGRLSLFFDLCFVTVCLVGAMAVRRGDLFTTGVLAPLAFATVILAVAIAAPGTFAVDGSISGVFLTGLAQHAGALVAGYAVALATVAGRVAAARV